MCVIISFVLTVIAVLGGWLSLTLAAAWAGEAGWSIVAVTMLLAPLLTILVHETGHLMAGIAAGMPPVLMIAGPFGLYWPKGRSRPELRLNGLIPGGFTLCLPHRGGAVRQRMILMTAGGPAASLILAVGAAAIAVSAGAALRGAAMFTGLASAALFLASAIPWSRRGMTSDGAKIRLLMKADRRARAFAANLSLLAAARHGTPPGRWPETALETALAAQPDTPEKASALHLAYWKALDEQDHALAENRLAALRETTSGMSEAIAAPVAFEAAAFHLFVRREPESARALIEGRTLPVFQDSYPEPLVHAGLALAAGDAADAARLAKRARAEVSRALFPAVAALHARWLEDLEAALAEPAQEPVR